MFSDSTNDRILLSTALVMLINAILINIMVDGDFGLALMLSVAVTLSLTPISVVEVTIIFFILKFLCFIYENYIKK